MCGNLEVMGERRFCKVAKTAWHIVFDNKVPWSRDMWKTLVPCGSLRKDVYLNLVKGSIFQLEKPSIVHGIRVPT